MRNTRLPRSAIAACTLLILCAVAGAATVEPKSIHDAAAAGHAQEVAALLKQDPKLARAVDGCGWTPLHYAAQKGHVDAARLLLDNGADASAAQLGWTALHDAAASDREAVVRLLIERKAPVNAADQKGWTPLHCAIAFGNVRVTKLLLEAGADLKAKDGAGQTPLHLAAEHGRARIIAELLQRGVEPLPKDNEGRTPVDLADESGFPEAARVLLERAVAEDIFAACRLGSLDNVKALVKKDPKLIRAKDRLGMAPLHHAAKYGQTAVVKVLLERKASRNVKDKQGRTPEDMATTGGHAETLEALRQGADPLGDDLTKETF